MRIVFMGTPDFALVQLSALIDNGYDVVGVITQPDKPVGRKGILTPPPVKEEALKHNIPVFQPVTLKNGEGLKIMEALTPELAVVAAYGKILPPDVLSFPKYGCINIHGSLLPKYRGAAPIQRSVLNGEKYAGITSMQMNEGLDTGDILLSSEIEIGENETSGELYERLAKLGCSVLLKTLDELKKGTLKPIKQNDEESTYAAMLDKSMSPVCWEKSAAEIHNQIRGLDPWPVASTVLDGKTLKLFSSEITGEVFKEKKAGSAFISKRGLNVVCGDKAAVLIKEVQFEGKKRMSAADFFRGHALPDGFVFNN